MTDNRKQSNSSSLIITAVEHLAIQWFLCLKARPTSPVEPLEDDF